MIPARYEITASNAMIVIYLDISLDLRAHIINTSGGIIPTTISEIRYMIYMTAGLSYTGANHEK